MDFQNLQNETETCGIRKWTLCLCVWDVTFLLLQDLPGGTSSPPSPHLSSSSSAAGGNLVSLSVIRHADICSGCTRFPPVPLLFLLHYLPLGVPSPGSQQLQVTGRKWIKFLRFQRGFPVPKKKNNHETLDDSISDKEHLVMIDARQLGGS